MAGFNVVIDEEWRISDWHRETEALTQFRKREVIGRYILDFFTKDVLGNLTERLEQASRGGEPEYFQISFYTKTGERLDTLMYASATDHGEIVLTGDVIPSMSPCAACSPGMSIGVDSEGFVTEWSEEAEAVTGFSSKHLRGEKLVNFFMTENFGAKEFMIRKLKRAFSGKHVEPFTLPIFSISAGLTIVNISIQPHFFEGQIVGVTLSGSEAAQDDVKERSISKFAEAVTMDRLLTRCPSSDLSDS